VLNFFDCNVILGRLHKPTPGGNLDAEKLLREMDRYGIREALVYHILARRSAPVRGNRLASEAAATSDRLHACWVVLPPATGELPPLEELEAQMTEAGVRAVRMFPDPAGHLFSLSNTVCGKLFAWMEARRLPLFLEQTTVPWRDLDELLSRHPGLPVVLVDITYRINRELYPLLKTYPQLSVEISYLQQHRGIEDICERFGSERLLFGSKIPYLCPGSARHMVEKAAIPTDAKAAIAGRNLRNLLAAVRLQAFALANPRTGSQSAH
jgi:predicted TIM-barrel fold metal-dependent hydrolase